MIRDLIQDGAMNSFNIHEAKAHCLRVLARVQAGKKVILAKVGVQIARIVPRRARRLRMPDTERSSMWLADDFDAPLADCVIDRFESS